MGLVIGFLPDRHQKFAELRAQGMSSIHAYLEAYEKKTVTNGLRVAACRLEKRPEVAAKIREIRDTARHLAKMDAEKESVLSIIEKRRLIAEIVRAAADDLNDDNNKHLVKKYAALGHGEAAQIVPEGYDKLAAIKLDNELEGLLPKDNQTLVLAQVFANMQAPAAGEDKM